MRLLAAHDVQPPEADMGRGEWYRDELGMDSSYLDTYNQDYVVYQRIKTAR